MRGFNIAIASTNRRKYSETFIHSHYRLLEENDLLLSDGYLPGAVSFNAGESFEPIQPNLWERIFHKKVSRQELLARILKKNKIKVVLAEYGPAGVELWQVCKKLGIKLVVHFHGYDAYRNDILNSYGVHYKALFDYASQLIVVSKDMQTQLIKLGAPFDKVQLIPYGVEVDFFKPEPSARKQNTLVFCGRFVAKKAPHKLIRVFELIKQRIPEASFTMIGDGELLESTKKLSEELGLMNAITFTGVLSKAEVKQQLADSKVYLQHSEKTIDNDSEGTPLSILEAMAMGLPVVSTHHAGISDVISHGENGYLVEINQLEKMADLACSLLQDAEMSDKIGRGARAFIEAHHTLQQYLHKLSLSLSNVGSE